MAKEYIDKDIAVKGLRMAHDLEGADFVANIPAADVRENIKAEWIPFTRFGEWESDGHGVFRPRLLDAGFKCSACGTMKYSKTKWCPDCGAEIVPAAVQVDWLDGGAEDG